MNGVIGKKVAALGLAAGLMTGTGCGTYHDVVDPCYPARYSALADQEVNDAIAPQVHNGHVLDQTVWNDQFDPGTAHLTPAGMEHLAYLARRRPGPDPVIYLQVAEDIPYVPSAPEQFVAIRNRLDSQRIAAVQQYLAAQTAGRGLTFTVVVHDPHEVGTDAISQGLAVQKLGLSTQGVLRMYGSSLSGGSGGGGGGGQ